MRVEVGKASNFGRMVEVGVGRADKVMREVGMRAGRVAKVEDGRGRVNKVRSARLAIFDYTVLPVSIRCLP